MEITDLAFKILAKLSFHDATVIKTFLSNENSTIRLYTARYLGHLLDSETLTHCLENESSCEVAHALVNNLGYVDPLKLTTIKKLSFKL